jgi:hypothetical protein
MDEQRYRAERTHPDQEFQWQVLYPGDEGAVTRLCTQGVAEVIAFALNAIADGKALGSPWPPTEEDSMYRYGGMYDGPTDGIKP